MLGKNIKIYREKLGFTQEQLAIKLNISPQAISKWERSESMPDSAMLPSIADVLGISIDRLFNRTTASFDDVANIIRSYIDKLHQKQKLEAIRQIAYWSENVMLGNHLDDEYFQKREWDLSGCSYSVCNETDEGFTFSSNRAELPFYSIFIEPQKGWKAVFKQEDYTEFFEIMADASVIKTLFRLYETKKLSFDDTYAEKEFGISEPGNILDKIEKLGVLWHEYCNIDGKRTRIWTFNERCGIIAIFAILNEFLYHNHQFELQSDMRTLPYLSDKAIK